MTPTFRRVSLLASDSRSGGAVGIAAAAAAVALCTGLIYPLKHIAPVNSLGVVYMVAVPLVSALWGVGIGAISAIESVLAFDYFQLPPTGSLSLKNSSEWVALGALLIAATLGGYVARVARSRSDVIASRTRIIAAADSARERLARDLHDGAQQRLVSTLVNLQLADQQYESDPASARELLQAALKETTDTIAELRELAHGVHPAILTNRGLGAACDSLAARSPVPVEVHSGDERYPAPVEAAAYFFIAEALTNVAKHAQATRASVRVGQHEGSLLIDVNDDGRGGANESGDGLRGLRDRIEALGGQMTLRSLPEDGTHLRATITDVNSRERVPDPWE
jgi:signal transduction histidine kinase